MNKWEFQEYTIIRKKKKIEREEFLNQFIQCDKCGYRNKKIFLEKTGVCNCCGKVLDVKAKMKYEISKKNVKIK